ncbi:MAG: glyoxylate/hydroxypyruvate reductase A [Spiribacter salinus]|uniref:Glyoxylate/hydroxypyruvate reductase A n=1 Tax=Spiribacter salinus TaxID=1335746 RepID=A0A540VRE0_9GAMM|nr:MAG: glyoxylate/hydroxypyruvate reductase A [Spiribacter salinus]
MTTVLFHSDFDPPEVWKNCLARQLSDLEFRVWPDVGVEEDVEVALVWKPPAGMLKKLPNLKLIVNLGAGVDAIVDDPSLPEGVPITRLVDPEMGRMMTQYVLLAALRHHRDFVAFERARERRQWHYIHPRPTSEVRIGVMGLGHLGSQVAQELRRQGFDVAGWARSRKALPEVESFVGQEELGPFLQRSDILVVMLPLTAETDTLLDQSRLAMLPQGAKLINVGRGQLLDEHALVEALRNGHIAEATLDVFREEPLPPEHPFWSMDQVLVTPHLASVAVPETAAAQVADNICRAQAGEAVLNRVEPGRGY